MGIFSGFSDKLAHARKAERKIIDDMVQKAAAFPEYMAFEKVVVAIERQREQYEASPPPASEAALANMQGAMNELTTQVRTAAVALNTRLLNEGVYEEHMHDVLNGLNDKAMSAARNSGMAAAR